MQVENRLQRYEEHAQLAQEKEEEEKSKEQELKQERIKRRGTLFMILQQREEGYLHAHTYKTACPFHTLHAAYITVQYFAEKKHKLLDFNRRQSEELKREADLIEKHWKESHEQRIHECREMIQRQHQFWLRRSSRLPPGERKGSKKRSTIVNFFQEDPSLIQRRDTGVVLPAITETLNDGAEEINTNAVGKGEVIVETTTATVDEDDALNNKKKVHFGDAECMIGNVLSDKQQ